MPMSSKLLLILSSIRFNVSVWPGLFCRVISMDLLFSSACSYPVLPSSIVEDDVLFQYLFLASLLFF